MLDFTPPSAVFRFASPGDVPQLVDLGARFFAESELGKFSTFSPENFAASVQRVIASPDGRMIVFAPLGDIIEGFNSFHVEAPYTAEKMAFHGMIYVTPEFRRSPAGRLLMRAAMDEAKRMGATVFYAGAMAGVPGAAKSLGNMLRKCGFEDTDFFGRAIL